MGPVDFSAFPLWMNLAVFAVAGSVIWFAGTRLSRYADEISERTGLGAAFIGVLLLGGITSLPEVATTVTASVIGNAPLAVNNLFGGVAMQVAILALADLAVGRRAITATDGDPVILLQGALGILLLVLCTAGMVVGDTAVLGVGLWTTAVLLTFLVGLYLIKQYEADPRWIPVTQEERRWLEARRGDDAAQPDASEEPRPAPERDDGADAHGETEAGDEERADRAERTRARLHRLPGRRLGLYTAAVALVILVAGYVVARVGDVLATETGLGSSFVGAVLVAVSTSLPEVSTTIEAVRLGAARLAFSNIFGTNLFDLGLLFVADAVHREGAVLAGTGAFSEFAAILGIAVTLVYMIGIIERRDRTILRFGPDSLLVLACYLAGTYVLFTLR